MYRAYLDIETTGISWKNSVLTLIGVLIEKDNQQELCQLCGNEITAPALLETMEGVQMLYTYNGLRFDLPFIKFELGLDLNKIFDHTDLMYLCWDQGLKGGLKRVEKILGIPRELPEVDGKDAIKWWHRYTQRGDEEALQMLLRYNSEDVINLKILREWLEA